MSKKVQVAFDDAALEVIESLQQAGGGSSMADVVRNALNLYEWSRVQMENGLSVGAVKRNGLLKEVVLPFATREKP